MIILLVLILVILLIALIPVKIYLIFYIKAEKEWGLVLKVKVAGHTIKKVKFDNPFGGSGNLGWQPMFLKSVAVERISIYFKYGFDDPFLTGIAAGLMWNIAVFASGILSLFFDQDGPVFCVDLKPDFSGYRPLELHFESIMSTRIGHIIIARLPQKNRRSEGKWTDILSKT